MNKCILCIHTFDITAKESTAQNLKKKTPKLEGSITNPSLMTQKSLLWNPVMTNELAKHLEFVNRNVEGYTKKEGLHYKRRVRVG